MARGQQVHLTVRWDHWIHVYWVTLHTPPSCCPTGVLSTAQVSELDSTEIFAVISNHENKNRKISAQYIESRNRTNFLPRKYRVLRHCITANKKELPCITKQHTSTIYWNMETFTQHAKTLTHKTITHKHTSTPPVHVGTQTTHKHHEECPMEVLFKKYLQDGLHKKHTTPSGDRQSTRTHTYMYMHIKQRKTGGNNSTELDVCHLVLASNKRRAKVSPSTADRQGSYLSIRVFKEWTTVRCSRIAPYILVDSQAHGHFRWIEDNPITIKLLVATLPS